MQLEVTSAPVFGKGDKPTFVVEFSIDDEVNANLTQRCGKDYAPLSAQEIIQASLSFFGRHFENEMKRFHASWGTESALRSVFAKDDKEFYFRVGRFSHVECMTVEKYREVQSRGRYAGPPRTAGSARTLVDGAIPFGWLACRLESVI